ncbi:DUF429 domain-containing protein [Haloferax sp. DFSO52]|uniref:DUF429 domain-containing protein n=1 Tax=Haloferax sp. DFSO52 TaxID=3388505 RepID=UPI003A8507F3
MPTPEHAVGIDGCRAGWVCARYSSDRLTIRVAADFDSVWTEVVEPSATCALVDIPIGLPSSSRRACDSEARRELGERASTVFFAPVRGVLDATTHEEASDINRAKTGYGLSIQAWNLVPKIRAVDSLLGETPAARRVIHESHPELAFASLAGRPLRESKSTPAGCNKRLDVLSRVFPDADPEAIYQETVARTRRCDVARDDILDALVLAAAAQYPLDTLPEHPPNDSTGLQMAIHVPRVPGGGKRNIGK